MYQMIIIKQKIFKMMISMIIINLVEKNNNWDK